MYGLPTIELFEQAQLGRVAIGGCTVTGDDPERECVECGVRVWRDGRMAEAERW